MGVCTLSGFLPKRPICNHLLKVVRFQRNVGTLVCCAGAWLAHGNMSDHRVDLGNRIANRANDVQPPYAHLVFVHYAKRDDQFQEFAEKLLTSNTSLVPAPGPVLGPFTVDPPIDAAKPRT